MSEKLAIVRRWVELYNERTDVTEFLSLLVAGLGRTEVRWLDSGEIAREFESAAVFWFRNGKIVRWQPSETYDAALKAAGLAV